MAQVRRPVPFRTRKLRPGTAMVLHSTGCGRVARRRITRTGSPDTLKVPGLPAYRDTLRVGGCISRSWASASWASPLVRRADDSPQRGEPETGLVMGSLYTGFCYALLHP